MRAKGCIDDLLSHGILAHCDPVLIPRQVAKKAKKKTGRSRGGWNPIYAPKRELYGSDENPDNNHLMRMAGRFSRRLRAWAEAWDWLRHVVYVLPPRGDNRSTRL